MTNDERINLQAKLSGVFRPGAPINSASLFSGRRRQVTDVIHATFQAGQHIAMFGERGVGKTSLAKTLDDIMKNAGITALNSGTINCGETDDFSSLWRKVFRELQVVVELEKPGFGARTDETSVSLESLLPYKIKPDDVRVAIEKALAMASDHRHMIVILDEVDRIQKKRLTALLADTIKNLSDHLTPVTIILIGVADAVDQLIAEHRSIERSLIQVPMPRMSKNELGAIIASGFQKSGMKISEEGKQTIISLSQGLPHFTHLLSLESAFIAVDAGRIETTNDDVLDATRNAVQKSRSLLSSYLKATESSQKNNLFREVLLACARTPKDELGWFSPADVSGPLSLIMQREYPVPYFESHLAEFVDKSRGPILEKRASTRQHKYRFINPLMEPFVMIHALSCGLIVRSDQRLIQRASAAFTAICPALFCG